MSDFKIDKSGASAADQRQLQKLILELNPDALPKYGADGDVGSETTAALQEILGTDANGEMSIEDATKVLQEMVNEKALEVDAGKPVSEASKENVERVQQMIKEIDPDALPKFGADGDAGSETLAALKALSPDTPPGIGIDLSTASIEDVVANLQAQIDALPERHIVDDCENLTEIAREHYADDIKEYTTQLMESGDPKFANNETAARVHAEQIAVTKIAMAPGNEKYDFMEGDNAHTIFPGQVIEIPDAGSLKEVDGSLDWEALDAAVGPGGPCGCDGESPITPSPKEITSSFTPAVRHTPSPEPRGLPHEVQLGPNCKAVLDGSSKWLWQSEAKPKYNIVGEELNGEWGILNRKLKEMGYNVEVNSAGSCDFPHEGGDNDPDPGGHVGGVSDSPDPSGPSTGL